MYMVFFFRERSIVGWNLARGSGEREVVHVQEENLSADGTLVLSSSGDSAQSIVLQLVKLPLVDKIPPYTTWIFLDKYSVATLFDQFDDLILGCSSVLQFIYRVNLIFMRGYFNVHAFR